MFEVVMTIQGDEFQGEPFTSTAVPGMDDGNESELYAGNYTENDPRRCYVLGEADACVRSVFKRKLNFTTVCTFLVSIVRIVCFVISPYVQFCEIGEYCHHTVALQLLELSQQTTG